MCLLLLALLWVPAAAAPDDPVAFAEWFVEQDFQGAEYHQWAAVLAALIDGIDRSREAKLPIEQPVYTAILSGTKYHTNEACSALRNASKILTMDIKEAKGRGFEACSRCK